MFDSSAGGVAGGEDVLGRLPWEVARPHGLCQRARGLPAADDLQQVVGAGPLSCKMLEFAVTKAKDMGIDGDGN